MIRVTVQYEPEDLTDKSVPQQIVTQTFLQSDFMEDFMIVGNFETALRSVREWVGQ